jgi:HEAT repeat protein
MSPQQQAARATRPFRLFLVFLGLAALPGSRLAADRFPEDPVERFKQTLQVENNKSLTYKGRLDEDPVGLKNALRYRQDSLEKAASELRTPSDLSRALLLIDWPRAPRNKVEREAETKYDRAARDLEHKIREEMTARFIRSVRDAFRAPADSADAATRQVATANLVGETVSAAGDPTDDQLLSLYRSLQPLAKDLASLAPSPRHLVREAAARALGQFPNSPKVAADALRELLGPNNPESTRHAAADALSALALNVSTNQPIRGSEPGVSTREMRRTGKIFELEEVVALVKQVARAAAAGLEDPSAPVRRSAINAIRQASEALAFEVRGLLPTSSKDINLPPADRPWSKEEAARVAEHRRMVAEQEKLVAPALRSFRNQAGPLQKAMVDADAEVRLNARRALNSLSQTRELLEKLRDSVPTRPAAADKADAVRLAPPPPRLRLPIPATPVSRRQDKEKGKGKAIEKDEPDKADKEKDKEKDKEDEDDKDADPIGTLLRQVGERLVREGYRDPNPDARRATLEMVEAMGTASAPFIPQLIESLKDRDLFVRWVAARALGKLAPREAAAVVPALTGLLDDEDLDPRTAAAKAIGQFGPDGAAGVPALTARLHKGDAEFRLAAMKALEGIGTASAPALPGLAKALGDIDPRVRSEAARILGRFGPQARGYVEDLRKLSTDPDSDVRRAASGAILSIVREK